MAKIIRRKAVLVDRNVVVEAAEKSIAVEKEAVPSHGRSTALKIALDYSDIDYLNENEQFVVGDLNVLAVDGGYMVSNELYKKPIDIIRMANMMVRKREMAPIEKGKEMDRMELLKERSRKLGVHLEVEGPTDNELDTIDGEPVSTATSKKIVEDEEEMTEMENDVAIEYLCGGIVDDGFVPEISKEPVKRKEVEMVDMTDGLKSQMINMGLMPWEAEGDGELAIMLIDEAKEKKEKEDKWEEAQKRAYRNYLRAIGDASIDTASMFGHSEFREGEIEQLIKMSY